MSPSSWEFGQVLCGSSHGQVFTVANRSADPVACHAWARGVFSVISQTDFTLAPGQSMPVTVMFRPLLPQSYTDAWFIDHGTMRTRTDLHGTGWKPFPTSFTLTWTDGHQTFWRYDTSLGQYVETEPPSGEDRHEILYRSPYPDHPGTFVHPVTAAAFGSVLIPDVGGSNKVEFLAEGGGWSTLGTMSNVQP